MGFFCESLGLCVKSPNFLWFGYFGWHMVLLFCCAFLNLCGKFPMWASVFSLGRCQCVSLLNYKFVILASVLCNLWCQLTIWFVTHSFNFVIWGFAHDLILWCTAASLEFCWWREVDHFISWLLIFAFKFEMWLCEFWHSHMNLWCGLCKFPFSNLHLDFCYTVERDVAAFGGSRFRLPCKMLPACAKRWVISPCWDW